MRDLRYRFLGFEELPASLGAKAVQEMCVIDPQHLEQLKASNFDNIGKLSVAAQYVFLQVTGTFAKTDRAAIPQSILTALSEKILGYEAPLATFRAVSHFSDDTLKAHRKWVRERLGFKLLDTDGKRELERLAVTLSAGCATPDDLEKQLNIWLFDRRFVNPGPYPMEELARTKFKAVQDEVLKTIDAAVSKPMLKRILAEMFEPSRLKNVTILEWLRLRGGRQGPAHTAETAERVIYLKSLNVHEWGLHRTIPPVRLAGYASKIYNRPPSQSRERIDDTLKIELICFLVHTLKALSNETIERASKQRGRIRRRARRIIEQENAQDAVYLRGQIISALHIGEDVTVPLAKRHKSAMEFLRATIGEDSDQASEEARLRELLIDENVAVCEVLDVAACLDVEARPGSKEKKILDAWNQLRDSGANELPSDFDISFLPPSWQDLVDDPDRKKARKAFEACVMETVFKALNGSKVWVDHSEDYRDRKAMLLSDQEWADNKVRLCETYALPIDGKEFVESVVTRIKDGLKLVENALNLGNLEIDEERCIRVPAQSPMNIHPQQQATNRVLAEARGTVQISEILMTVDKLTGFSRIILGRRAQTEKELVRLYGALLVHGMQLDVTQVANMLPQVTEDEITTSLKLFERASRMHTANGRITELQQSFPIVKSWGDGTGASADMMALDASMHLYLSRVNPRRKTYGTGIYTTILNSYPIIWNQHIVQNTWQAGAAVHGVHSFNTASPEDRAKVVKLAVDTHGYTHVAMGMSKLLQIELCPHLAHLPDRKLIVTTAMKGTQDVPDVVDLVTEFQVSDRSMIKAWDDMLRTVASICSGRVTADWVISRMGSDGDGDPVKHGFEQLGKLLRTVFLCDYHTNPEFYREVRTLLNRGESVHTLQRAISPGRIQHSRARSKEERDAISSAHTLLVNCVIAFNTMRLDERIASLRAQNVTISEETLRHISPGTFGHVNFRGLIRFETAAYADHLIARPKRASKVDVG